MFVTSTSSPFLTKDTQDFYRYNIHRQRGIVIIRHPRELLTLQMRFPVQRDCFCSRLTFSYRLCLIFDSYWQCFIPWTMQTTTTTTTINHSLNTVCNGFFYTNGTWNEGLFTNNSIDNDASFSSSKVLLVQSKIPFNIFVVGQILIVTAVRPILNLIQIWTLVSHIPPLLIIS